MPKHEARLIPHADGRQPVTRFAHVHPTMNNTQSRHQRSQRKQTSCATRRRPSLEARMRAHNPERAHAPPRQQEAAPQQTPPDTACAKAEVCSDGINLIRSTISDKEGSYLVMSTEVPVTSTAAYDAWPRFDDVPHFMRGRVIPTSHDGSRMTSRIRTLFDQFAWQGKVFAQLSSDLIAWKSEAGAPHPKVELQPSCLGHAFL